MPTRTILVEDSKKIRDELIPTMVELANVEVIAIAESADEAEALFEGHKQTWQLAVIDLFLKNGSSGLTVLRYCRERLPSQKVVVLTNYATTDMRKSCSELGADALFDKSTELDGFLDFCGKA